MTNAETGQTGRRAMLLVMALAVTALFATSFVYRMLKPELRVEMRQQKPSQGQGMMQGDPEAMARVQELMARLQQNPQDRQVNLDLAEAFLMMQAYERAEHFARKLLELDPDDVAALRIRSMTLFERKEYAAAVTDLERILAKAPGDAVTHYNLGILYKHYLKRPDDAQRHFRAAADDPKADTRLKKEAAKELSGQN